MTDLKKKFALDLFEEIKKCKVDDLENENCCYITGNVIEQTNLATIKPCGHKFDKVALKNAFKAEARFLASPGNVCPYCRSGIELIENFNPNPSSKKCSYIFKKGKQKGQYCCSKAIDSSSYCKKHTKA